MDFSIPKNNNSSSSLTEYRKLTQDISVNHVDGKGIIVCTNGSIITITDRYVDQANNVYVYISNLFCWYKYEYIKSISTKI